MTSLGADEQIQQLNMFTITHCLSLGFLVYIWWSTEARAVVVCGGMNWDLDTSDDRCWTYDTCGDTWRHVATLPWTFYGGVSARVEGAAGEELWMVGGGNGTASNRNLVSHG